MKTIPTARVRATFAAVAWGDPGRVHLAADRGRRTACGLAVPAVPPPGPFGMIGWYKYDEAVRGPFGCHHCKRRLA